MSRLALRICVNIFLALLSVPVFAQVEETELNQEPVQEEKIRIKKFSIETGPEAYFGYTLYQIGGIIEYPDGSKARAWFPLSELKFPLNVLMLSGDIQYIPGEKFILHANVKKNITRKAGKMEDSDWGVITGDPDSLDVFSKSDAKLDAIIINSDFQIKTYNNNIFSLYAGIGFLYQNFKYNVSNVFQTYPATNPGYYDHVSGKVLTYRIDYYIPYAEIIPCFNIKNKLKITHSFALSPYAIAKDVDDHLLRYKKSKGESTGVAFMTSLKAEYFPVTNFVFFSASLNYVYISTNGYQKQYQYREYNDPDDGTIPVGPIGKIENKIKSSQFSAGINAGVYF
jgi:outer membrane protease